MLLKFRVSMNSFSRLTPSIQFVPEFIPEFVPEFDLNTDFYSGTDSGVSYGTNFFMSSKLHLSESLVSLSQGSKIRLKTDIGLLIFLRKKILTLQTGFK